MASTDHLRSGSVTPSNRPASASISHNQPRLRSGSLASTNSSFSAADGVSFPETNGSQVSLGLHRSSTTTTLRSNGLWSKPISTTPTGLWGSPVTSQPQTDFDQRPHRPDSPLREVTTVNQSQTEEYNSPPNGGLWGAPLQRLQAIGKRGPRDVGRILSTNYDCSHLMKRIVDTETRYMT